MEVSAGDVLLYAEVVSGKRPAPTQGRIRLKCVVRPDPEHLVAMSVDSGDWHCERDCGHGDLAEYEAWRSKAFGVRQAENNIEGIIWQAKEKVRKCEPIVRPVHVETREDLPFDARNLLVSIVRHPGKSGRYHQQTSHLHHRQFHSAIRLLERRRLVSWKDEPSTGGRRRRIYFPLSTSEPSNPPS